MFVRVNSIGLFGMKSFGVGVEASIENGFPRMDIVGQLLLSHMEL